MERSKPYAFEQARRKAIQRDICVADIVTVLAFYPSDMTVDVKPMVKALIDGAYLSRPPILKVPVAYSGGPGANVRTWYNAGDIGVIVYMDRDSDNVLSTGGEAEPQTEGYHRPDFPVFLGGIAAGERRPETEIPSESVIMGAAENYISISPEGISICGNVSITGNIEITGQVNITGGLVVNGQVVPDGG